VKASFGWRGIILKNPRGIVLQDVAFLLRRQIIGFLMMLMEYGHQLWADQLVVPT